MKTLGLVAIIGTAAASVFVGARAGLRIPVPASPPKSGETAHAVQLPPAKAERDPRPFFPSSVANAGKGHSNPVSPEAAEAMRRKWLPAYDALTEGRSRLESGDLAGAEKSARRCIELTPKGSKRLGVARFLIGDVRMESGDYEGALEFYRGGSANDWRYANPFNVAICLIRLDRHKEARPMYSDKQLLKFNGIAKADLPGTGDPRAFEASVLLARGFSRYFSGHEKQALQDFEAVDGLAPGNPIAAYYRGKTLLATGRMAEAKAQFRVAVKSGKSGFVEEARSWIR
jgi:tetratricopeptide (TPR) repeat protein